MNTRRILLVLTAAGVLVTMLAIVPGPAFADDIDFDGIDDGFFFCDDDDDDFDGFIECEDFFFDFGNGFQDIDQESESGDIDLSVDVSSEGDFAQQSVAPLQFANTGNFQNAQGFTQFDSTADDIDFDGGSFEFDADFSFDSNQSVRQSSAAHGSRR